MSGNYLQSLVAVGARDHWHYAKTDFDKNDSTCQEPAQVKVNSSFNWITKKKKILGSSKTRDNQSTSIMEDQTDDYMPSVENKLRSPKDISEPYSINLLINSNVPIPILRLQWMFCTQFLHSMLYQIGVIPMPFSQLQNSLIQESSDNSTTLSYRQRTKKRKMQSFVEGVHQILFILSEWISIVVDGPDFGVNSSHLPFFGFGFGPSLNNLKKIFLLSFPSPLSNLYDSSKILSEFTATQIKQYENRLQRQFIQKLIEYETVTSHPTVLPASKQPWRRGNLFLFLQLPSTLLSSMRNELLDLFAVGDGPSFTKYLVGDQLVYQQKKWLRRLSIVNLQLSSPSSSSDITSTAIENQWLVLRRGIKLIPPSTLSDQLLEDI